MLGVVDFLVIKTLAIDWKVEVKGWIEVTSRQLNEVRPQLGSRMVSTVHRCHKPLKIEEQLHCDVILFMIVV